MTTLTTVEWTSLTNDEQATLLRSPALEVDAQCLALNFDLTVNADVSDSLVLDGSSVSWSGSQLVSRTCQFGLSAVLPWGQQFVQLLQLLTDPVSGLSARRSLGVFCPTAPGGDLSESPVTRQVTGQDRTYLLDRRASYDVSFTTGAAVTDSIVNLLVQAGIHPLGSSSPTDVIGLLLDPAVTGATVTRNLLFPQLGDSSATSVTMADGTVLEYSAPATWRTMLNTLLAMVPTPMRAVWADEVGRYRCTPYVDPATAAPLYRFDSDDPNYSTVGLSRTPTHDLWQAPNAWTFVQANPPSGVAPLTYTTVNSFDGDSSISARNNLWFPADPITVDAETYAELAAKSNAITLAQQRAPWTAAVTTGPFPAAGHFDVFTWADAGLDATWKVVAASWELPLDGGDVAWSWTRVG